MGPPTTDLADSHELRRSLADRVDGEVRFDAGTLAAYSTDASNYRQVPIGVVIPRCVEAAVTAIAVCREYGAPVVSRGGGTSLAGQCTNTAVMIDWSKCCNRLVSVDVEARTCVVEPGIVLDVLNEQLRHYGLGAAQALLDALGRAEGDPDVAFRDVPEHEDELWQAREAGLRAAAHVPDHPSTWPGWEDAAVDPARLGDLLRELESLFEKFGYADDTAPSLYGHFGQGCVHTRIPFDLTTATGIGNYRHFVEDAADLVVRYGGSLSGEHGDGQARAELLSKMFGDDIVAAFGQLKAIFDPDDRMNPGKVVAPNPLDRQLRLGADWAPAYDGTMHFAYPDDGGSFVNAATRCVGVGRCRQHSHEDGSVMCPSYQVTRDEEHATRGRARLLFEMLSGHPDSPITNGWRSTAVRDALDLCLSCKG